eukprot:365188-Chlamydomonas_euryale.AAC.1
MVHMVALLWADGHISAGLHADVARGRSTWYGLDADVAHDSTRIRPHTSVEMPSLLTPSSPLAGRPTPSLLAPTTLASRQERGQTTSRLMRVPPPFSFIASAQASHQPSTPRWQPRQAPR